MIRIISHRGNISGINPATENNPQFIEKVLDMGYDVEVDVWCLDGKFYLGHDFAEYLIDFSFLKNNKLWCHAKNLDALNIMLEEGINCFWHQEDDYTITSTGFIWTYPGKKLTNKSVIVLTESHTYRNEELKNIYGICTDNIDELKNFLGI